MNEQKNKLIWLYQGKYWRKFLLSTIAFLLGIWAVAAGLSGAAAGNGDQATAAFFGIILVLGALAYKSAKKRFLGIEGSWGKKTELVLLIIALAIPYLQNNGSGILTTAAENMVNDPATYTIPTLWVIIAYCSVGFRHKKKSIPISNA